MANAVEIDTTAEERVVTSVASAVAWAEFTNIMELTALYNVVETDTTEPERAETSAARAFVNEVSAAVSVDTALLSNELTDTIEPARVVTSAARALLNEVSAPVSVDTALLSALESDDTATIRSDTSLEIADERAMCPVVTVVAKLGSFDMAFAISESVSNADDVLPPKMAENLSLTYTSVVITLPLNWG